jgi:glutathione peroxidase
MTALRDIQFRTMDGTIDSLAAHEGEVVLVVNVASRCGLTPQYEGLQRLYEDRAGEGFIVLAFPANDFGDQEPGTDAEIAEFCSTSYDVAFPVMSKIEVTGPGRHPLYAALAEVAPTAEGKDEFRENLRRHGMTPTEDPDVLWNFEKFLVGRDGTVLARFAPSVAPDDPVLLQAVASALLASASAGSTDAARQATGSQPK